MPTTCRARPAGPASIALVLSTWAMIIAAPFPALAMPGIVRSGSLQARAIAEPWQLVFEDASGAAVLEESSSVEAAHPGAAGFRTGAGWMHATRARWIRQPNSSRLVAIVDTTDPLGRRLRVDVQADGEGVIRVSTRVVGGPSTGVEALGVGFAATSSERFFGFGERSNALDQRGQVVEHFAAEGPFQPEEREFVALFAPAAGFRPRDDATYFPIPWLLSSRGVGVLVDNAEVSTFRLATDSADRWSVEVAGAPEGWAARRAPDRLTLHVFAGPRPADALRRFTERTGRQPPPAAPWLFGPWIQLGGSLENRVAQLAKLRDADVPVSAVQTYTHYLPCGSHQGNRDAERAQVRAMHDAGAAVTTYFNPMICESYEPRFSEAVAAGALSHHADGSPYIYDYTGTSVFRVGQFDFDGPAGRASYATLLSEAIADGHDGWMEDFGEYTPLDAFGARRLTGAAHHNRYPVSYHCAAWSLARGASRPIIRFQRSGWTGVAPCAQVVWNGDPSTDWGFDGLTSALWNGLGMGMSGIALWGSDVGGFFALGDRALTPELLKRWVQLGAVSGVMRTQHNGVALPAKPRPQIYDDEQVAHWRRYAKLRTQLYPYITAAADEYRATGLPIMRHLALTNPEEPAVVARDDQFLFGPDILAAPVLAPGATNREVTLPSGEWIDLWRSAAQDPADGALHLGVAAMHTGNRKVVVPAPLDEIPLLVRAGAILPLLPADVDTLADYGDPDFGLVRLGDREGRSRLLAFPRGVSEGHLYSRRERWHSAEAAGAWELEVDGLQSRSYELEASLATLQIPFVPCTASWNGRVLASQEWNFDPSTHVFRARFAGRRGVLKLAECRTTTAPPARPG